MTGFEMEAAAVAGGPSQTLGKFDDWMSLVHMRVI